MCYSRTVASLECLIFCWARSGPWSTPPTLPAQFSEWTRSSWPRGLVARSPEIPPDQWTKMMTKSGQENERRLEILPTYYPCHDFVSVIIIDLHVFFFYKNPPKIIKIDPTCVHHSGRLPSCYVCLIILICKNKNVIIKSQYNASLNYFYLD